MSVFSTKPSPFFKRFLERIAQLNYPKSKISLRLYVLVCQMCCVCIVSTVEPRLATTFLQSEAFENFCNTLCSWKYDHLRNQNCDQLLWSLQSYSALAITVKHMRTSLVFSDKA